MTIYPGVSEQHSTGHLVSWRRTGPLEETLPSPKSHGILSALHDLSENQICFWDLIFLDQKIIFLRDMETNLG